MLVNQRFKKLCNYEVELAGALKNDARKLHFFGFNHFRNSICRFDQLWVGGTHLIAYRVNHLVHKGFIFPEQSSVANPTTQDLSEDVSSALVRR